ncbi:cadherin domain-containing protein [Haloferula rosea]|uniref:Cadherin domain-containing protein n=1 Tax=Haloferula rosea TaxID=490093 RepID=A0A934VBB1_9BACT|nr:cadherin domain-containing protein [Haloferula rosea]MBK1827208.1 cadherin domain-containing protein [Haloferula rosea]
MSVLGGLGVLSADAAVPVAQADRLLVEQGGSVTTDYLLANDSDADGDPLSITSTSTPANGVVTANGGGSFTYTPNAGFTGDDSFTYDVSDGSNTVTGTVAVSVNASINPTSTRDALLAGVATIADPTQPGHMTAWGPTAVIVSNYSGNDERRPMIVAGTMGAGRVVAMGDHQWLNMDNYGATEDTGSYYLNTMTWLAGTTDKTIKVVTFNVSASTFLANNGFTNVVVASSGNVVSELATADVCVTWMGNNASQAIQDAVGDFTKAGGGLFLCDYGVGYSWWWGKHTPDIPGNRVLRDVGIGFVKNWPSGGLQSINRATREITDDDVVAVLESPASYSSGDKDRAAGIFDSLNEVLADDDTLQARLDEVFWSKIATLVPTPTTPVSDSLEKALLNREGQLLQSQPVADMVAHRAALPVSPSAPRVNTSVTLDPTEVGHAYRLIDTGLYAAPGEPVDITVPAALAGIGMQVRIGHLRTDTGDSNYYTMPYQQLTFEVDSTTVEVGSPHGGLLMFVAPSGVEWATSHSVQVDGAVEAPYFVLGEHSNADWTNGIRDRGTPFGVLRCDSTVLVIESEQYLRTLADPVEVMSVYNPLIATIADFYDYDTGRELRIHHDYQPAGGVSAFPLSYGVGSNITDSHRLVISGEPLTMHEHGHHADNGKIIFYEFGETSPNLGGKYAQQVLSKYAWKQEIAVGRINNYLRLETDNLWQHFNHYAVDVKGTPFDIIAGEFGWESLKNIVHAIGNLPSADADTDQEKLDQWLIQTGNEVGYDVSPFLELWQLSFSASAKAAVDALPEWNYIEIVGEDLVLEQDSPITFGDPTGNDFSYDGTLTLTGWGSPANGSLVDNGDGTRTYTPNVGFTGSDTITYTVANGTGNSFTGVIKVTVTSPANYPDLETGKTYAGTTSWTTVTLDSSYTSMVVVAQPVLTAGSPPVVTRIRNAAGNSFEVMLQRADGQSGAIEGVPVQYLAVEEGVYDEATHGIKMEAVKVNSTVTDTAGNFVGQAAVLGHDDVDHYFIPVMFGQVMTYNDSNWSTFWASGGATGYAVGKHVGEDPVTTRANETLGYVIMEAGSMQIGGTRFQAGGLGYDAYAGFNHVSSGGTSHDFIRMPQLAGAIVQAQGTEGSENGYWTVLQPTAGGNMVSARLVEDQIGDAEQSHGNMGGSYLLFADFGDGLTAIDDAAVVVQDAPTLLDVLANDFSTFPGVLSVTGFTQPANGTVTANADGTLTYTPNATFTGRDLFFYDLSANGGTVTGSVQVDVRPSKSVSDGVLMETWTGISGGSVGNLTGDADFPDNPDASEVRSLFEAPTNRADSFGTRMTAHLIAPATGDYTFWVASDDDSQLFLSTDRSESKKSQIASVSGWTGSRQWDKFSSQQSAVIPLVAGQAYYIEVLHKEGGGGDNLAVGWQGPGITQAVIDGAYLKTVGLNAPVVASSIQDVVVDEGSPDTVIEVSSVFTDADPADPLSLAVHANSNPSLVTTNLVGGQLTISYAPGGFGSADISVRAVDGYGSMAIETFSVTVNPLNADPVADHATFAIDENSPSSTPVGTVTASDPDVGDSLTYAITGGNTGGAFAIDSASGAITVAGSIDHETTTQYVLTVTVTDDGTPQGSDTAIITVNVNDVVGDDSDADGLDDAWELANFGGTSGQDGAGDPDADGFPNGLEQALGKDPDDVNDAPDPIYAGLHSWWRFNESSGTNAVDDSGNNHPGVVSGAQFASGKDGNALDFDGVDDGVLMGSAAALTGTGDFSLSAWVKVAPGSPAGAIIHQREPGGSGFQGEYVLNLNADGTISFFVYNSGFQFDIKSTATVNDGGWHHVVAKRVGDDGTIYIDGSSDATGTGPVKALLSRAVSVGYDNRDSNKYFPGSIDDVRVYSRELSDAEVLSMNNAAPVADDGTFAIGEDAVVGATVGQVSASDPDAGDSLSYAITGGNTEGAFSIDSNGNILTAATLDHEALDQYVLTVEVSDDGTPVLTDSATLTIDVSDVNEAPTVSDDVFAIDENASGGSSVGAVSATDPDAGDVLGYAITGGNSGNAFAVDGNGLITTTASLDHENISQYVLTVTVTDSGLLADIAMVSVTVNDLNESPTVADAGFSVDENSNAGTVVGAVSASDPDDGDALSYAITAGNTGGAFTIDGSGVLTVAGSLDYETLGSYSLTVEVVDGGLLTDTAAVTVGINDLMEVTPPAVASGGASNVDTSSVDLAFNVTDTGGENPVVTLFHGTSDGGNSAGSWASSVSLGAQAQGAGSTSLGSLDAGTQYYFTFRAVNSAGEAWTSSGSFTTDPDDSPKLVRTTVSGVSSSAWTTVALGQNYNSPVIIATPIYPNTSLPPVVTRIRNITAGGFDIKLDRADGQTAATSLDVSVVVVEEGVYTVAEHGVKMEAVTYNSTVTAENNNWAVESRSYQNAYTNPVVVGQVMSANDAGWSVFWSQGATRQSPANSSNLNVGKHVGEDPDATRVAETIGYLVIESGTGTIDGVAYEAALGADTVRGFGNSSSPYTYSLSGGLGSASAAALSISGMDGGNGAWAVLSGASPITPSTLGLHALEDQMNDSETKHTTTQVGYLVFE